MADTEETLREETTEEDTTTTADNSETVKEEASPVVQQEKEKKTEKVEKDKKVEKVEVRLQAAGDAPIMKAKKYMVDRDKPISWIITFIRKYLKLQVSESLYVYVNQAFSPSPDQTVGNLADCFSQDNKLVLYYSRGQAWG